MAKETAARIAGIIAVVAMFGGLWLAGGRFELNPAEFQARVAEFQRTQAEAVKQNVQRYEQSRKPDR